MRLDPDIQWMEETLSEKKNPSYRECFELARLCKERGYVEMATELFDDLYEEDDQFPPLLVEFADLHFTSGVVEQAIELYREALATNKLGNSSDVTLRLALCYYRIGDTDRCKDLLHGIIKENRHFTQAYPPLIGIYFEEKDRRMVRSLTRKYNKSKKAQEKKEMKEIKAMFQSFLDNG